MNEFLSSNNENSLEYIESIMADVNYLVNSEAVEIANIESSNNETKASQINNVEQVCFAGSDELYEKLLALEDQLLCKNLWDATNQIKQ